MHSAQDIINASLANARVMISENIRDSDKWLFRGILCLLDNQTADEQTSGTTKYDNGVGFSGVDSQIMTSFGHQIQKRGSLSVRQKEIARKLIQKYCMQLARSARAKAAAKAAVEAEARIAEDKAVEIEAEMGYRG